MISIHQKPDILHLDSGSLQSFIFENKFLLKQHSKQENSHVVILGTRVSRDEECSDDCLIFKIWGTPGPVIGYIYMAFVLIKIADTIIVEIED